MTPSEAPTGGRDSGTRPESAQVQATAAFDTDELAIADEQIASVADGEPEAALAGRASHDPLLVAIAALTRREGVRFSWPRDAESERALDDRLGRIASASDLRFSGVSLDDGWWNVEGPPMLVQRDETGEPLAVFWDRSRFRLLNPTTRRLEPIDAVVAPRLRRTAYVLHPALPDQVTPAGLRRFALQGLGRELRALLAVSALIMLLYLLVPVATGVIVATAIPDDRLALIDEMVLILAAATVGAVLAGVARSLVGVRAATLADSRLQAAVWDRLLRLPPKFFLDHSAGDLARRLFSLSDISRAVLGPASGAALGGIFGTLSFILMLFYDWRLALYGFAFALLCAAGLVLFARPYLRHRRSFLDAEGRAAARTLEMLAGIDELRLAAAEERAFARWAEVFAEQQHARFAGERLKAWQSVGLTILPAVGVFGIFIVADIRTTPIDLAAFAAFNVAFGQFVMAVSGAALALTTILDAYPALDRIMPIVRAQPEIGRLQSDPGVLSGNFTVRHVSFRYEDDGPAILDRVSFSVSPGEYVAIVGPSGSGKSTLVKLLLGFEAPRRGAIFYDDQDFARLDATLVRRQIGTVLQSAELVPGTLYQNIAGAAAPAEVDVWEAVRQAGLADDIERLPMGLRTFLPESAGTLSAAQRQRIKIASALMHNPQILIFDDAMSALDERGQASVKESLKRLKRTRLVVAHRISTVRDADKILVLDKGRIVESGRFDELMAKRGAFYRMAEPQLP